MESVVWSQIFYFSYLFIFSFVDSFPVFFIALQVLKWLPTALVSINAILLPHFALRRDGKENKDAVDGAGVSFLLLLLLVHHLLLIISILIRRGGGAGGGGEVYVSVLTCPADVDGREAGKIWSSGCCLSTSSLYC